jgi:hypothetical protein
VRLTSNAKPPFRQKPIAGQYGHIGNSAATSTSNTLGGGSVRVYPVPIFDTWTISRIGAEITAAGTAGSLLRLVVYRDTGSGRPGDLEFDGGTIDGSSATVQEITVSKTFVPGNYWFGGVLQGTLTSQPTVRVVNPPMELPGMVLAGLTIPGANGVLAGYLDSSGLTVLPSPFTVTGNAGSAPRIFVKFA